MADVGDIKPVRPVGPVRPPEKVKPGKNGSRNGNERRAPPRDSEGPGPGNGHIDEYA